MAREGTLDLVLTGPEASGKTTLAAALAACHGSIWVPEAARRFVEADPTPLSAATVEPIARLSMSLDDAARAARPRLLVHDTDLVSTVVYARHYYGQCPEWIVEEAMHRRADLYLLCRPDLPWEDDGVRDRPMAREQLFEDFRSQLEAMQATYEIVEGIGEAREAMALEHLRHRLGL